jgi:hypothetical protein
MLMNRALELFDKNKASAAIRYLMDRGGIALELAVKLLYIADFQHLGKYGRTIFNGEYIAGKDGIELTNEQWFLDRGSLYFQTADIYELSFSDKDALKHALREKLFYKDLLKSALWHKAYSGFKTISYVDMAKTMRNGDVLIDYLDNGW